MRCSPVDIGNSDFKDFARLLLDDLVGSEGLAQLNSLCRSESQSHILEEKIKDVDKTAHSARLASYLAMVYYLTQYRLSKDF